MTTASVEVWEAAARLYARDGEIVDVYSWPDGQWSVRLRRPDGAKTFRWMSKNGSGFKRGRDESLRPPGGWTPYGVHTLNRSGPVFGVEGNGDVDNVDALGLPVVTSGSVTSDAGADWSVLAKRDVVLWPDNDQPGKEFMRRIAEKLHPIARSVRVIDPTKLGLGPKEDVSDWLAKHREATAADVLALIPAASDTPPEQSEKGKARLDIVCLADVETREVEYLWRPYLPLRVPSLLTGDPSAGKTFIAQSIAAELSCGRLLDGREIPPATTLYLTTENPLAEVLRPRFDSLGGDPQRLFVLRGAKAGEGETEQVYPITLSDVATLEEAIKQTGARLVVVDPIQSYLGADIDLHRSNETRPVLDGLARLAEKYGIAVLMVRHLTKQAGGRAIHRGLGSIDLTGAVRSELLAGSPAEQPQNRALVHIKSNMGPQGPARGYSIDENGKFEWTGDTSVTAADILAAFSVDGGEKVSKVAEASVWLDQLLSKGPCASKEVEALAKQAGISERTLRRAKKILPIDSHRRALQGGWFLERRTPPQDGQMAASQDGQSAGDGRLQKDSEDGHENAEGGQPAPTQNLAAFAKVGRVDHIDDPVRDSDDPLEIDFEEAGE